MVTRIVSKKIAFLEAHNNVILMAFAPQYRPSKDVRLNIGCIVGTSQLEITPVVNYLAIFYMNISFQKLVAALCTSR